MRQVGGPRQPLLNKAAKSVDDAQMSAYAVWHSLEGLVLGSKSARGALDYAMDIAKSIVRHLELAQAVEFDVEPKPPRMFSDPGPVLETELLVQEVTRRLRNKAAS